VYLFVVADAGIAWDLSSTAFSPDNEIIGATFWGKLVEHITSCLLWEEISSGWVVTTICPRNATNFAWGSSGGKKLSTNGSASKEQKLTM
jgi:hypothetical protein